MTETATGRHLRLGTLLMVVATVAAYAPSLGGSFLWDDDIFTYDSPIIRDGRSPLQYWQGRDTPDYYPVLSTGFWLQWQVFERNAAGYRVVNLILHVVACLLLWRALAVLRIDPLAGWLGAMLFALHPVNVASVAWIAEQKNTLSMVFFLGALLAHLRFHETGSRRGFVTALLLFAAGLLCKASIVVLPALLVVLIVWRRGAVRRGDLVALLPMFAVAAAGAVVAIWFQSQHATAALGPPVRPEGLASRIAASGWMMWFYLGKTLWPLNLMMIYPRWAVDGANAVAYLPLAAMIALGGALLRRRSPWLVPLACYLIAILPVLGFIDMVFNRLSLVADHWIYVGMPAVTAAVAVAVVRAIRHAGARLVAIALLCAIPFGLTFRRSAVFKNSEALWTDNVARNTGAPVAYNNLGDAIAAARPEEAVEHFRRAIELDPDYAKAHYNLAFSMAEAGRLDEAIESFRRSVSLNPLDVSAQRDLGRALLLRGRTTEALEHLRAAANIDANHTHVLYWLGIALSEAGESAAAAEVLRQARDQAVRSGDAQLVEAIDAKLR